MGLLCLLAVNKAMILKFTSLAGRVSQSSPKASSGEP
jgi:hypothetical protein